METLPEAAVAALVERVSDGRNRILGEVRKVIVGQDHVIDLVLAALFTGGHCLITGVPGLAKTLLIKTLGSILDLSFKRIQFTNGQSLPGGCFAPSWLWDSGSWAGIQRIRRMKRESCSMPSRRSRPSSGCLLLRRPTRGITCQNTGALQLGRQTRSLTPSWLSILGRP